MIWSATFTIVQNSGDRGLVLFFLAVVLPVVLVAGLVVGTFSRRSMKRRQGKIKKWAEANGLRFCSDNLPFLNIQFPGFVCLSLGSDAYACNVVQGRRGRRAFTSFDYHCALGKTEDKQELWFSAVLVESDCPLMPLYIRPRGFTDRISEALGKNDGIRFESREFNSAFYVQSPDRKWACDVIHPRMMEFILSAPRFTIKFGPRHVMAFRDSLFKADEFQLAAELAEGILDRFPDYVKEQQGTHGQAGGTE